LQSFFFSSAVYSNKRMHTGAITSEGHPAHSHITRLLFVSTYINRKTK
jgi:hypothetical protein